MKEKILISAVFALILSLSASDADCQPMKGWRGSGGWGTDSPYQKMYNPAAVETVKGEVLSVDRMTPMKGMSYGIHLQLRTERETLSVHLGPGWYIERLDAKIEKGDRIEVRGSRITSNDGPALIAGEVRKDDHVLILRDADGLPIWAGWRR